MVGPFMLPAKLLLQRLADKSLNWDSDTDRLCWDKWLKSLPKLNGISIPRIYHGFTGAKSLELHCFADASSDGYGAVCYFCARSLDEYTCSFVIGKSRVVPVKRLSAPRLELCAAVVAVRLAKVVECEHDVLLSRTVFWSDSSFGVLA